MRKGIFEGLTNVSVNSVDGEEKVAFSYGLSGV